MRAALYISIHFFFATGGFAHDISHPQYSGQALIKMLKTGNHVVYFRHHKTRHDQEDIEANDLSDCRKQRNLSEEGVLGAKVIGQSFKKLHIPVSKVFTSPYCRCVDTAKLAFGKAEISDSLYFAIGISKSKRQDITRKLRKMLGTKPDIGTNTVIVSHTANLKEAANLWPEKEGQALVFLPGENGEYKFLGSIMPKDWNNY